MRAKYLLVVILAALDLVSAAALLADENSWVGESIFPTKARDEIVFKNGADDQAVEIIFSGAWPLKVLAEEGDQLKLHDGRREGWVKKSDFVRQRDAESYFSERLKANPHDTRSLTMRGSVRGTQGAADQAIADFSESLRLDPQQREALNFRGLTWLKQQNLEKALADFEEAIRISPQYPEALCNRGCVWRMRGENEKALQDFNQALQINAKFSLALFNRGIVYAAQKQYDIAMADFDATLEIDSSYAPAFNGRGHLWEVKGDLYKALEDYGRAIETEPKLLSALYNRGRILHLLGRDEPALLDFNSAIALKPDFAEAYSYRGVCCHSLLRFERAIDEYNQALRLNPRLKVAWVNRGTAWLAKREYDRALQDVDEALKLEPDSSSLGLGRVQIMFLSHKGDAVAECEKLLNRLAADDPVKPYVVIYGYFAARQSGNEERAKKFLANYSAKPDEKWPASFVCFLRGEIEEAKLLELAGNGRKLTAYCFLGLYSGAREERAAARVYFDWVKKHGNAASGEWIIADQELARLESQKAAAVEKKP